MRMNRRLWYVENGGFYGRSTQTKNPDRSHCFMFGRNRYLCYFLRKQSVFFNSRWKENNKRRTIIFLWPGKKRNIYILFINIRRHKLWWSILENGIWWKNTAWICAGAGTHKMLWTEFTDAACRKDAFPREFIPSNSECVYRIYFQQKFRKRYDCNLLWSLRIGVPWFLQLFSQQSKKCGSGCHASKWNGYGKRSLFVLHKNEGLALLDRSGIWVYGHIVWRNRRKKRPIFWDRSG